MIKIGVNTKCERTGVDLNHVDFDSIDLEEVADQAFKEFLDFGLDVQFIDGQEIECSEIWTEVFEGIGNCDSMMQLAFAGDKSEMDSLKNEFERIFKDRVESIVVFSETLPIYHELDLMKHLNDEGLQWVHDDNEKDKAMRDV